ncbi:hypothetical protein OIU76_002749 [Salix suchowensis]|nr:hypothetical protein OIU76_002749 [Salix suchowensis]
MDQFFMHVFAPDGNHLKIRVTDYHSNTFETIKSAMQLDDMRDCIGIGGSWNEFVEYLVASLKAEDVKLVLEKLSNSDARDCMANMSFGLFKAFKCMKNMVVQEKEHSLQLTKIISAEKERSENIQRQLGKRQKLEKMNSSDKLDVSGPPASNGAQNSPDKLAGRDPASTKVTNRVVPAFRRAKVRGALLQDIEDDKDNLKPT